MDPTRMQAQARPGATKGYLIWICAFSGFLLGSAASEFPPPDQDSLSLPQVGFHRLRILHPALLELTLVTTKRPDPAPVGAWNFVNEQGQAKLPSIGEFVVSTGGTNLLVQAIGFKRRVLYAPFKHRDLRIANYLYLQMAARVPPGQTVRVTNPGNKLWNAAMRFVATNDPVRWSPALHVPFECYQKVLEADFTSFTNRGEYRLKVPDLGTSFPFFVDDAVAGAFARTYALGLYHQRCGTANELPFTRFTHKECHTAATEVPDTSQV